MQPTTDTATPCRECGGAMFIPVTGTLTVRRCGCVVRATLGRLPWWVSGAQVTTELDHLKGSGTRHQKFFYMPEATFGAYVKAAYLAANGRCVPVFTTDDEVLDASYKRDGDDGKHKDLEPTEAKWLILQLRRTTPHKAAEDRVGAWLRGRLMQGAGPVTWVHTVVALTELAVWGTELQNMLSAFNRVR